MLLVDRISPQVQITEVAGEPPVVAEEFYSHTRAEVSQVDLPTVERLLASSVKIIEEVTGRALRLTTLLAYFPRFGDLMLLHPSPFDSIVGVSYFDSAGASQSLSSAVYEVARLQEPAQFYLRDGQRWPDQVARRWDAVAVEFKAGYATRAAVPTPLRLAVLQLAAHWLEHPEPSLIGTIQTPLPWHVGNLVDFYRIKGFGVP